MNNDWFTDYAQYRLRVITIEQEWLELRYLSAEQEQRGWITKNGRHILIGEDSGSGKSNYAKHTDPFSTDYVPSGIKISPQNIEEELNGSEVGREALQYINETGIRPKLIYRPQQHSNRGEQCGNDIKIFVDNIPSTLVAAQTVIHEITHHKYGIGQCQWAEAVCMAKEKMHKENRTHLTIAEKRYIVGLARKFYGEYNWKKGGTLYGRKKW